MAGRYFGTPFATTGDKTTTPDAVQPDGSVSYSEGFGFDYELDNSDPAYKPVPRDGMNGLFFDITEALGIAQRQGVSDWTASAQPYAINAVVRHSNVTWISTIGTNNSTPGANTDWRDLAGLASDAIAGLIELTTNAEVQALTDTSRAITPAGLAAVAVSANIAERIVRRDASGNFAAGTITAALIGNASTAAALQTARTINGTSFNGTTNITITANTGTDLSAGNGLTGSPFNGGTARTFALGTPSALTNTTPNSSSGTTHTHELTGELVETTTGSALYYGARAFVNFNGTNGLIRAAANVTSVTRRATSLYTLNFATPLPDENYTFVSGTTQSSDRAESLGIDTNTFLMSTTQLNLQYEINQLSAADSAYLNAVIFR